jgi:chromosome partitioning protein
MEEYSIQGIYGMLQLWKQETYSRSQDNPIELIGILPNKVRGVNLHRDFLKGLKNAPGIADFVMPYMLKERTIYAEVDVESANPRTIFDLGDNHLAKQEAIQVCEYIYGRVFDHG